MRAAFFWASLVVGFSFLLISLVSGEIKVGVVSCLSGGLSTFGISSVQGAKLAAEEINAAFFASL
jgi:ABC-type branched-subunit amino acid transport system substrate-binding protein